MKSIVENFNLSILELLTVLLPGATGLFFLNKIAAFRSFVNLEIADINDVWIKALIYFGASYFLGYVIYVSSSFLDSWYDRIKRKALQLDTEENSSKGLQFFPIDYKIGVTQRHF